VKPVGPVPRAGTQIAPSALTACGRVAVARLVREHAAGLPLRIRSAGGTSPMEPALTRPRHEAIEHDYLIVHEWRVAQLTRLGIPWPLAPAAADQGDRHQGAKLVHRGWPARLARPNVPCSTLPWP